MSTILRLDDHTRSWGIRSGRTLYSCIPVPFICVRAQCKVITEYSTSGVESGMQRSAGLYFNTSLHADASPISAVCCLCFARGRGFVSTSAV